MRSHSSRLLVLLGIFHCSLHSAFALVKPVAPRLVNSRQIIRQQNRCRSSTRRDFAFPGFDLSHLTESIGHIDQFIQGALNQATSTPQLIAEQPLVTNVPELNLVNMEEGSGSLYPLGNDLLIFLCTTIGIVPLFKWLKASPVIGFLTAGLLMGPAGLHLFSDLSDMESLADFGVLFLLFEQGLELTVDRLKSLSKYAFGMGTLQVLLCTFAFFIFPFIGGVQFLEIFMGSDSALVDIERVDEALVIGAALSLSSSAFVLKILQEKGQLASKFGAACLGILLLQDIAVVPLLVLLPIIESNSGPMPLSAQLTLLGVTFLKAIGGLGGILVVGGAFVRYLFSLVAKTKSSETFVALCLLVALGTGALTDELGLSSTLGAFTAGTLLAESNYRTQIESDIKPFRGLLLGLFFLTTGATVEPGIILQQWPTVAALLAGLIAFKAIIIAFLGPRFGLSRSESVRTGLLLSGGGEFAFVVLNLADKLHVLPDVLAKLLVGVVVISMAITPYLSNFADKAAEFLENMERKSVLSEAVATGAIQDAVTHGGHDDFAASDVVVICGFGPAGQLVARYMSEATVRSSVLSNAESKLKYVAFDLDPDIVANGYRSGNTVLYGDGSQPKVLATAGIENPRAFVVTYDEAEVAEEAVDRLRRSYPSVPIVSRALDGSESFNQREAGATHTISDERESSLRTASVLLKKVLTMDAKVVDELGDTLRAEYDQEDTNEYEIEMLRRTGTVNVASGDRLPLKDSPFKTPRRDLMSLFSGTWNSTLVDDASAMLSNMFSSVLGDDKDSNRNPPRGGRRGTSSGGGGEGSGAVPASSKTASIDYEKNVEMLGLQDIDPADLGVLVCALPPKNRDSQSADNK